MCAICVKKMCGCPVCPAARKYARLSGFRLPGTMPGCPELCPVARYARLPGILGCLVCPAARKYARKYARLPGCSEICPAARNYARKYVRLPGNMPGCPAARNARLPGNMPGNMPGCPELCPECPAPRHRHYDYAWTPNAKRQRRCWRPP